METFSDKIRAIGGEQFDPFFEERGGWIAGEAPRSDASMPNVVIGVLAYASIQGSKDSPNPFRA